MWGRAWGGRDDAGATLTEYALFIAVFVLVALAGAVQLDQTARDYFDATSSGIGRPRNHDQAAALSTTTIP